MVLLPNIVSAIVTATVLLLLASPSMHVLTTAPVPFPTGGNGTTPLPPPPPSQAAAAAAAAAAAGGVAVPGHTSGAVSGAVGWADEGGAGASVVAFDLMAFNLADLATAPSYTPRILHFFSAEQRALAEQREADMAEQMARSVQIERELAERQSTM
jgi:hypothetical protein